MPLADDLSKLTELRANGGLTEEEFKRAKERLGLRIRLEQAREPRQPAPERLWRKNRPAMSRWPG